MPSIGAIVTSFEKEWIFRRFWESLQNQTRQPDKIIVVDDGSRDGTGRLVQELCQGASVTRTPRVGQSQARNVGLGLLDTDLVIFLDGDLTLQMNMLGRMEQELEDHPEASFVYSHFDRTGVVAGKVLAKPWNLADLRSGNFISPMSLVYRNRLPVPCFDPELERYEDWDLWLRMGEAGWKGRLIDEVLFTAHYRAGDLSSSGESQDHFWAIRQKHRL